MGMGKALLIQESDLHKQVSLIQQLLANMLLPLMHFEAMVMLF